MGRGKRWPAGRSPAQIAIAGFCAGLGVLALAAAPASAALIGVDTAADIVATDGSCSLREAVDAANTNSVVDTCPAGEASSDTIVIHYGTTYFLTGASGEDANLSGDLDITGGGPLVITPQVNGTGTGESVIDAPASDRILDIHDQGAPADVTLLDLALRNGNVLGSEDGGAILVNDPDAKLQLEMVRIRSSHADDYGGAVSFESASNSSTLDILLSEFRGNSAGDDGGAVYFKRAGSGTAGPSVRQSAFVANTSGALGGGFYYGAEVAADTSGTIANSTFSGNSATQGGGAIGLGFTGLFLNLEFVTVADNSSTTAGRGGGIQTVAADQNVSLRATILADNTAAGLPANCARVGAAFTSNAGAYNIETADTCDLEPGQGDLVSTDPLLAPLMFGAGTGPPIVDTWTHGLYDGSPALDAVPLVDCSSANGVDQRDSPRPNPPAGSCDAGAFEGSVGPKPQPAAPAAPAAPVAKKKKCKKGFKLKKIKKKGKKPKKKCVRVKKKRKKKRKKR